MEIFHCHFSFLVCTITKKMAFAWCISPESKLFWACDSLETPSCNVKTKLQKPTGGLQTDSNRQAVFFHNLTGGTVDGREIPNNHLRFINPVNDGGKNYQPQLVTRISSINSSQSWEILRGWGILWSHPENVTRMTSAVGLLFLVGQFGSWPFVGNI